MRCACGCRVTTVLGERSVIYSLPAPGRTGTTTYVRREWTERCRDCGKLLRSPVTVDLLAAAEATFAAGNALAISPARERRLIW